MRHDKQNEDLDMFVMHAQCGLQSKRMLAVAVLTEGKQVNPKEKKVDLISLLMLEICA